MMYENEIGLEYNNNYKNDYNKGVAHTSPIDPPYR